jgi:ORF6N domain
MISSRALDSAMPPNRKIHNVERAIYLIRGQRVMLDSDLAAIYGTSTMRLNEQFRRNRKRFPDDFAFVLTREEFACLISQIAISKKGRGGRRKLPIAFTEHGAIMLASVLNSSVAVQASVRVVRAFVRLREMVSANAQLATKLAELERRLDSHDEAIVDLFATLRRLLEPAEPTRKREIGFHVRERSARYRTKRRF